MSSIDFTKEVSQLIESQFPAVYREEGEQLVAFVKAYYEFLESDDRYSYKLGRDIFDLKDIDTSIEDFLYHFKEEYLADFPFILSTDKRFVVKHIIDYYRSKGSKQSLELLMKLLFKEEVNIYSPGEDVIRPSDSLWYKPFYIEVTRTTRNKDFLNQQITGATSGAKAFVESIVEKRIKGKIIDVMYLSGVRGTFMTGERVSENGIIEGAPKIKGSLTSIEIESGGRDNQIGDIYDVVTPEGVQGKVKVTAVRGATGTVDFQIVDGGWGFTNDARTDVYVSDAVLFANNSAEGYLLYEKVYQPIETIEVLSGTNVLSANVGDLIEGKNGTTLVANGVIVSIANTYANGTISSSNSATGIVKVQTNFGSFTDKRLLVVNAAAQFAVGETIQEESRYEIAITNLVGSFTNGEKVEQIVYEPVANSITHYAFGTVLSSNSTLVTLEPAWGPFLTSNVTIRGVTSGAVALPVSVTTQNQYAGARGKVVAVSGNNVTVDVLFGAFEDNNLVRGDLTKKIYNVVTSIVTGASIIYKNANNDANAVVSVANNAHVSGIIVGQNTSAIGIFGNTSPFFYANTYSPIIKTERELLISPPRYANGEIISQSSTITRIAGGAGAGFGIAVIEDIEQNVTVYTDIIGANNVAGIPYTQVKINGQGSGFGFVQSITVNTGGTGYANNARISFVGGGYGNGDPLQFANAFITTNGSGAITTVTVDVNGAGYFQNPSLVLPATGGTVATVTPVMNYGYGFPKAPSAENLNMIGDVLSFETMSIGSIALLGNVNPGQAYTADPFVNVRNRYIAAYQRKDIILNVSNVQGGSFRVGERLVQVISNTTTIKGRVTRTQIIGGVGQIFVERTSLNVAFNEAYPIIGQSTGASATITAVIPDESTRNIGENAVISSRAGSAEGVATQVEIVTSGFGYVDRGNVTLTSEENQFVITGISGVQQQGISEGYWRSTTSQLNSEKKIHDNKYYQEYSYDILSGLSLNRYESILKKVFHVSGTRMFGSVVKTSFIDSTANVVESSVTQFQT